MFKLFNGKKIMVTGCCGTIGKELINQLLYDPALGPGSVIGVDNNETEIFFQAQQHAADDRCSFFICDVRDKYELRSRLKGVDLIFHCAAYKHVVLSEISPNSTLSNNLDGLACLLEASAACGAEKVIFTSSDKAVSPTNVMGATKLIGERMVTAANFASGVGGTKFSSTRFGNVLGSNGSVIPIFVDQIKSGGPVTVTHAEMSRFAMSVKQSASLVISSSLHARGGEVFVTKMPVLKIIDLAEFLIGHYGPKFGFRPSDINIEFIGEKLGEKLYEELMTAEESRRALELEDYFCILPPSTLKKGEYETPTDRKVQDFRDQRYVSSTCPIMSKSEIGEFLEASGLL